MKRINTINKKIMPIINSGIQQIYAKTEKGLKKVIIYNGPSPEQGVVESLSNLFRGVINKKFTDFKEEPLCEDSLVVEKDKYFYTKLDDKYNPFKSLNNLPGENDVLEEDEMKNVQGFFFEYYKNSLEKVFIYQKRRDKRIFSKSLFYKISGRAFEILEEKLFAFDTTIDILIYKNFAFYYDPKVINEEFGLDERTNKKIENKVSKMAKQFKGLKKCKKYVESLSTVYKKKINNIDKYGIIDMKKEDLISIIQSDENLSGRISIKDGDFEINNEKDFKKFINLMCDDYLQSNITKTLYISDSKHLD